MLKDKRFQWPIYLFAILILIGCGSRAEPTPEPLEPVELTLITLLDSNALDEVIEQFETANPHIDIKAEGYNQFPQQYLMSETPPDIMAMAPSYFLDAAMAQNLVVDLTDLWSQSGLADSYPAKFQALSEYNGKQYFVPIGYSWTAIYYNRAIFEQYNLTPPQTWDEFLAVCDTLLANGETPLSLGGGDEVVASLWFDYLNMRLNGPDFHRSLIRGQESYNDVRITEVFTIWRNLLDRGYFLENIASMSTLDSITAVIRGDNGQLSRNKAAMVLLNPIELNEIGSKFASEFDFFRFPIMDPSLPVGEVFQSLGYMVPNNAKHPLESIAFVNHMSSVEAQSTLYQPGTTEATFIPANAALDSDGFSTNLLQGMALIQAADSVGQQYFWSSPTTIQGTFSRALSSFLRNSQELGEILQMLEAEREKAELEQLFVN